MHRPTIRAKRQLHDDLDRRLAAQSPAHPREAAVAYIQQALVDRLAGLDPYDRSILILDAHPFERVWANRALELAGIVLDQRMWAGRARFRAIIDPDVRRLLGLDEADAPTVEDEPLASRAVSAPTALMDAVFDVLPEQPRLLHAVEGEPVSATAMRAAKDAYDQRVAEKDAVH